jgi:hypothetical protein
MLTTKTKRFPGGETTVTIQPNGAFYSIRVMHRFDSGNFFQDKIHDQDHLSRVAAEGLLRFYTA